MQIRELSKKEYVAAQKALNAHPLQSWEWGELKSENWNPLRLGVVVNDEVVAVFSVLIRHLPIINYQFGYIPRGIAVKDGVSISEVLKLLVEYGQAAKWSHLMIDPDVDFGKRDGKLEEELVETGFSASGPSVQPGRTIVLDLQKSEDEMLSDMRSKHRQYIRKAEKNGITIRKGTDADIPAFCNVLQEIAAERGYITHTNEYYEQIWDLFSQSGNAHLFLAEHKGHVVGSYMIVTNGTNAYEMYGGAHRHGRDLKANYLMKWTAIQYFKKEGFTYYDQWGAENIYPGLVQFKEGFSKDVIEFPGQYVYVYSKLGYYWYTVLDKVNRLRQKVN